MWIDERSEFCDATAISPAQDSTAVLGNVMDLTSNRDIGQGNPVYLIIQVSTVFAGGTSYQFHLVSDSQAALSTDGSETRHFSTDVYTQAQMTAGFTAVYPLPMGDTAQGEDTAGYERYLGITLTDVGSSSSGAINAFLTLDPYGWTSYPDGNN